MNNKPLILVTNDDGINSPGIEVLVKSLSNLGEIIVVAPDTQRSAVSSSLSINKPLRVSKFHKNGSFFGYSVDGTPTDCVKLAISTLLDRKPDLVVSGINHGKNTSINVLYSGTVAGAKEGYLANINSIAISHSSHSLDSDLSYAAEYSQILARKLLNYDSNEILLLNVNVPNLQKELIKGAIFTKLSNAYWKDKYEMRLDPFGNEYYWFAGSYINNSNDLNTDDGAIEANYVSVTALEMNHLNDNFNKNIANYLGFFDEQSNIYRRTK